MSKTLFLLLSLPTGLPAGMHEDQIILKTDHPQAGEVKIPIDLVIEASG